MKRKKGAKGSFNRVKRNDLLIISDPNSPSISIEGENNTGQLGESQDKFELEVEQHNTLDNKLVETSSVDDVTRSKPIIQTGYSRVKVKLKAPKLLEHKHSSDTQTPSFSIHNNTDKSNSQFLLGSTEFTARKTDITCSDSQTLEADNVVPETTTRKPGSIKIKSSRGSDFSLKQMESKVPHEGSRQNTKELTAALGVIRKIMKMDAAGPFNAPVNPVALGIPDYFEIIDTPMDFGSICQDLEKGTKYKNSHDVYTDVQFIWDNCYKYNNKGDYILDLMKRVKKNFMKYWSAAGLLTEMSTGVPEGTQVEDGMWPHLGKSTSKIKSKHKRRRYGIDGHKSTCLCAVCVVRRRRKEREEQSAAFESHLMVNHTSSPGEPKLEVVSADNKPSSEGTASSLDHSPEAAADADAEMDDAGMDEAATAIEPIGSDELEIPPTVNGEIELRTNAPNNETHDNTPPGNGPSTQHSCDPEFPHSNSSKHSDKKDEDDDEDHEEDDNEIQQGPELYRSGPETTKLLENPAQVENQAVLWLCRELFPGERKCVWSGPHSLMRRHASASRSGKQQYNAIRSALATIMNS